MIKLTRRDFIKSSTTVVIASPLFYPTGIANATPMEFIGNDYFQTPASSVNSSGPTIRPVDVSVHNTYERYSTQSVSNSSPSLAGDLLSCGISTYAVKSGLAFTASGVASPLGIALLLSGTIGLAACTVNLTGHTISASFGVSNQGISDATSMVSLGGMAGALYSGFSGQHDLAVRNARYGSTIESLFFGGAGIKTAGGLVDFGVGQLELSKGLYDLVGNYSSNQFGANSSVNESTNHFEGGNFSSSNFNDSWSSDWSFETSFGSSDSGGQSESNFEGSFGTDWSFESDFGSDWGGDFDSGGGDFESPGLGEFNY